MDLGDKRIIKRSSCPYCTKKLNTKLISKRDPTSVEIDDYCIICHKKITEKAKLVRCPECSHPFHVSHFREWLKVRGHCPHCRVSISFPKFSKSPPNQSKTDNKITKSSVISQSLEEESIIDDTYEEENEGSNNE